MRARRHPLRGILSASTTGIVMRRVRSVLSAVGIAVGIAAMVAVVGISESSRARLLATLDRLGTNLLRVSPGQSFLGEEAELPKTASAMIGRIAPVQAVASVRLLDATVRRTHLIDEAETGGISVVAADVSLIRTLGGRVADGSFLNEATSRYPAVVLGSEAAERLGIRDLAGDVRVLINGRWFTVVGILAPLTLAPELDRSAIIGYGAAARFLGEESRSPSTIYVRANPDHLDAVRGVLGATANPSNPEEVAVERPSDALAARAAARVAFTSLLLGLGAVALLVGGIGIANTMIVSVLERRQEIGLRRALGATAGHIWGQFSVEALLLSAGGGAVGVAVGAGVTAIYALNRDWALSIPPWVLVGGVATALVVGAIAGLYPAIRAARLSPSEALRST